MRFKIVFFLFLLAGVLWGQSFQLVPCDDMYTDCILNGPAHLEGELFINCESSTEEEQVLIKFDFSGIQGIQIESATLNLHRYFSCGGGGGTTTAILYLITEEWDEESWDPHTFVQYDSTNAIAYAFSGPSGGQNYWFEVNIIEFVNLWLYANQPNYGLVIVANEGQRHSKFDSKEASNPDFQPYLNITLPTNVNDIIKEPVISLSNYPNPFNPSTTISFCLNTEITENTELLIYNLKGEKIRQYSILNSQSSIIWNGTDQTNQPVSSGIYFYKIKSGEFEKTNKMILMK